jgi:uncharacterized RDD family membrane protein YckC
VPPRLAGRFGALVVDWLLCLLVANLIGDATAAPWLAPLVLIGEYAFFLGLFGQTPGMRLARLRCGSVTDGRPVGIPRAALRGLLLCLVVPALVMDGDRRGLHDRAVGSVILPA